jgi:hypothetical protein
MFLLSNLLSHDKVAIDRIENWDLKDPILAKLANHRVFPKRRTPSEAQLPCHNILVIDGVYKHAL